MRGILVLLTILISSISFSQTWDVKIQTVNYTSYFEFDYLSPTVVVYELYKGGGDCNRDKFRFKNDRRDIRTASDKDYTGSGWDRGHMVSAEDFAYDCYLTETTFRFYNCVPQHPSLNRGPWLRIENEVRNLSKSRRIKVMCINIFSNNYLPNSRVGIPIYCIKLIWDFETGNPIKGWVVNNDSKPKAKVMSHLEIIRRWNLDLEEFY